MRTLICAVVAVAVCATAATAADKKKGKSVVGVVKKIDPNTGTLTVTVKVKKVDMDKEFKIGDDAKVIVVSGDEKKELSAKDGLKNEQLKEGAKVAVVADDDGKVKELTINPMPKKKKTE
jgi:hypothetical protein